MSTQSYWSWPIYDRSIYF